MLGIARKRVKNIAFLVALFLAANRAFGQHPISSLQARNHIGEYSKVCGLVASTHFANRSRGAPTFINLDQPYPDQVFTAVIWVEDRAKFGYPEQRFSDRQICVSGVIQMYRGIPEIILRSPSQVEVRKPSQ
jgi:hypothetical protein